LCWLYDRTDGHPSSKATFASFIQTFSSGTSETENWKGKLLTIQVYLKSGRLNGVWQLVVDCLFEVNSCQVSVPWIWHVLNMMVAATDVYEL